MLVFKDVFWFVLFRGWFLKFFIYVYIYEYFWDMLENKNLLLDN